MVYRVDLAVRDLKGRLYAVINAQNSVRARDWFDGLEHMIFSLDEHPTRAAKIPEDKSLRHLLYGRKRNIYRLIFAIDEESKIVSVLHIRHAARAALAQIPRMTE